MTESELFNFAGEKFAVQRLFKEARTCFMKSIELDNLPQAHFNLAYLYLLQGNYERGFEEFEWRLKLNDSLNDYYNNTYDPIKQWISQDLAGKRLLLWAEQGLGDGIQFLRYVRDMKSLGAYIILHIHKPTMPLLQDCLWIDEIVVADINELVSLPEYDYQCSLMSLPYRLKRFDVDGKPYIRAVPNSLTEFIQSLAPFRVGVVWGGTQSHLNDASRSIPVKYFSRLHVEKILGLQVEPRPDLGKSPYVDLSCYMGNLKDTARILLGLDLLICCDTAVAHLAGAIGTPCWLLLPYNPDWRWGLTGDSTPWYDSLRLFRQKEPGNWDHVFEELNVRLQDNRTRLTKRAPS